MTSIIINQGVSAGSHHFDEFVNGMNRSSAQALTLEEIQWEVKEGNKDQRIAVERIYQAKQEIKNALLDFIPLRTSDFYTFDKFEYYGTLFVANAVLSIPSKWFAYKRNKRLAKVEYYGRKAITANLQKETSLIYYDVVKHQILLKCLIKNIELNENIIRQVSMRNDLGEDDRETLNELRSEQFHLKDTLLHARQLVSKEMMALRILAGKDPEYPLLELATSLDEIRPSDIEADREKLFQKALDDSYEYKQSRYLVSAMAHEKKSVKWSILGFTGIGFNYMARVRFAKSNVKVAKLRRQHLKNQIRHQVYTEYDNLLIMTNRLAWDKEMTKISSKQYQGIVEAFNLGSVSLRDLYKAQINYLKDVKNYLFSYYDSLKKMAEFERLMGKDYFTFHGRLAMDKKGADH